MNVLIFFFGLLIGVVIGAKLYSSELKTSERRKNELSAMYYEQLDQLTQKNAELEEELRLSKLKQ